MGGYLATSGLCDHLRSPRFEEVFDAERLVAR
jgi:hypothetical protein